MIRWALPFLDTLIGAPMQSPSAPAGAGRGEGEAIRCLLHTTNRSLAHLALLLLLCASGVGYAHEMRPGYLELRQTAPDTYAVAWKVPARGELRLALYPRFPASCKETGDPIVLHTGEAHTQRTTLVCASGLDGERIEIDGLASTFTDVLVRFTRADGSVQTVRLTPSSPGFDVAPAAGAVEVARTYTGLGIEHILLGADHLLFVLGLLLLVRDRWRLVKTITAFTVAHSITLVAATLGFAHAPAAPVEAAIALSIVFLAVELVRGQQGVIGLTQRTPWLVAFAFGLLHGFGFAGALSSLGIPQQAVPLALLFFNVGVEIGQLLFIALVFIVIATVRGVWPSVPRWAPAATAYGIGSLASFWLIQRVVGML